MRARNIFLPAAALFAAICFSGCKQLPVNEIIQTPVDGKIYTAHNIWYTDPSNISSVNVQQGAILPFGTEVEVISAYKDSIKFKDKKTGKEYYIDYRKDWMMAPIENYIKQLLTCKSPEELTKGIAPATLEKLKRGIVEEGMTRREVLMAYGYPVPHRTPSLKEDTWIYWTDKMMTMRVVFKGDKVMAMLEFKYNEQSFF
jgi:outer membrane protein assembly factor BamE (lipoprotein component of BamABCDE complex)